MRNLFGTPDEGVFEGRSNDNFELLKMWGGTTVAFAIASTGGNVLSNGFLSALLISAVVCGLAFVLHELAHRIVARHYGAEAHFVANNGMLLISIVIAFLGVLFAAPGAVWHRGYLTRRQSGLIALAGPATNFALAVLFLLALIFIVASRSTVPGWVADLCADGYRFNAWIGLFNMIPAGPFDGAKVLQWSVLVFGITVAVGILLVFVLNGSTLLSLLRFFQ
ncbi:MAG TPA: peptidase M50 [Roseiflexaceae bacterium]|nr:peptidase M50 [Roseiflexaceae bacterium]